MTTIGARRRVLDAALQYGPVSEPEPVSEATPTEEEATARPEATPTEEETSAIPEVEVEESGAPEEDIDEVARNQVVLLKIN